MKDFVIHQKRNAAAPENSTSASKLQSAKVNHIDAQVNMTLLLFLNNDFNIILSN